MLLSLEFVEKIFFERGFTTREAIDKTLIIREKRATCTESQNSNSPKNSKELQGKITPYFSI